MLDDFGAIWNGAPVTFIRDAIWGDIPLYRQELALIDSPVFQRLRQVRQLGPLAWVFPGANHTRFEHALGALHLARVLALNLLRQPGFPAASESDIRTLFASALLHDVGHYPFSHALEEVERPGELPDHSLVGAGLVRGPLAPILRDVWEVDPERVARLVAGTGPAGPEAPATVPLDSLWQAVVSGSVDVDRLDFLRRDAYFANVPYGIVDVQRILASLRVWPVGSELRLYLDEKGVGPMQSLIFGRFLMYGNVYWHHTGRIITRMLVRAVEDALVQGAIVVENLAGYDDSRLLDALRHARRGSLARRLLTRFEQRDLYKRAVELRPTDEEFDLLLAAGQRPGGRAEVEQSLRDWASNRLGKPLGDDDLWLDLPQTRTFKPIGGVICKNPPRGYANPAPWEAVSGLTAEDLTRLARSVQRVRILAAEPALAKTIARAWEEDRDGVMQAIG